MHRFICVYLCVFCVFLFHTACEHDGVDLMGLKSNPLDLSSFSAILVVSVCMYVCLSDDKFRKPFGTSPVDMGHVRI